MNQTIAEMLDSAADLPINTPARRRLETKVLEETGITNMKQVAALVEAVESADR